MLPGIPFQSGETKFAEPLKQADLDQVIARDECNLYIYGRTTYDETVSPVHHWRHTCGYWIKKSPRTFVLSNAYNDGDEDYPDGKEPD
jgi:hypothetical protein